MKKLLSISILCLLPVQLFATGQVAERIIIGKDTLQMLSVPLEFLDSDRASLFRKRVEATNGGCTALWRDYMGEWALRQDTLRLLRVYDTDAVFGDKGGSTIPMEGILAAGAPAAWFSGDIRVVSGRQISYEHMGFHRFYETETIYTLQSGVVVGKQVFHNHVIGDVNSFSDALRQITKDFALPATPESNQHSRIIASFNYIPDSEGKFAGFRKVSLYLHDAEGGKSEICDPAHPYLLELQRRLREIEPYGVCYKGEMQPIAWTLPLRLPSKNHE